MPDPRNPAGPGGDEAPELRNTEQEDEDAQAQTLAEALYRGGEPAPDASEKVPTGTEADEAQDLVDHMHQMETSGLIDMSAFAGERNDDEEEGRYGSAAEEE